MSNPLTEIQNWFSRIFSGNKKALFGNDIKIPENSDFNSKFDQIQEHVIIIKEEKKHNQEEVIAPEITHETIVTGNTIINQQTDDEITNNAYCPKCKNAVNDEDVFCMNCGTKLKS